MFHLCKTLNCAYKMALATKCRTYLLMRDIVFTLFFNLKVKRVNAKKLKERGT
jgi:hypothetical protein